MGCWRAFPPFSGQHILYIWLEYIWWARNRCHPPFSRTTANSISLHHPKAQLTGTCFKALVYLSISQYIYFISVSWVILSWFSLVYCILWSSRGSQEESRFISNSRHFLNEWLPWTPSVNVTPRLSQAMAARCECSGSVAGHSMHLGGFCIVFTCIYRYHSTTS